MAVSKWLRPLLTATAFLGIPFVSFEPAKQLTAPLDALDAPASTIYAIYEYMPAYRAAKNYVAYFAALCSYVSCVLFFGVLGFRLDAQFLANHPPPPSQRFLCSTLKKKKLASKVFVGLAFTGILRKCGTLFSSNKMNISTRDF